MQPKQFNQLLAQLLDGELTAVELNALASEVAANEIARQELIQQLNLDEGIRLLQAAGRDEATFASAVDTRIRAEGDRFEFCNRVLDLVNERTQRTLFRRMMVMVGALAATAALVLLAATMWLPGALRQDQKTLVLPALPNRPQGAGVAAVIPLDDGVAVITQMVNVAWEHAATARVGDAIKPGTRLQLRSGTSKLQFYRGAVVTLEGPAELEVRGVNDAVLHTGKAWAHVPEPAQGFTLHTPDIEVVDLGTEFGVEVVPGRGTQVSVFSGEVELYEPNVAHAAQSPISLTTGQGLALGAGMREEIAVDRGRFIADEILLQQQTEQSQEQRRCWQIWSDTARQDERVLLYYSFESPSESGGKVPNEAPHAVGATGHVIGSQWTEGRWPGKRALDFKRPSDRVRFQLDGECDAITLAAWVRIDGLDRPLCSLMLTDGFDRGEVHWQFNSNGELGLAIQDTSLNDYSRPLVTLADLGKWIHVASTYDRHTGQAHQYFNGNLVTSWQVTNPLAARFGQTEIGNWSHPVEKTITPIRNFNGRIDEFVLYRVALPGEEIRAMYEAGRPD